MCKDPLVALIIVSEFMLSVIQLSDSNITDPKMYFVHIVSYIISFISLKFSG